MSLAYTSTWFLPRYMGYSACFTYPISVRHGFHQIDGPLNPIRQCLDWLIPQSLYSHCIILSCKQVTTVDYRVCSNVSFHTSPLMVCRVPFSSVNNSKSEGFSQVPPWTSCVQCDMQVLSSVIELHYQFFCNCLGYLGLLFGPLDNNLISGNPFLQWKFHLERRNEYYSSIAWLWRPKVWAYFHLVWWLYSLEVTQNCWPQ